MGPCFRRDDDDRVRSMTLPLASRIALVTGASRGIGYATARALAKAGAHVVAVARTQGGLEELDDEIRKDGGSGPMRPRRRRSASTCSAPARSAHACAPLCFPAKIR